MRPPAAFPALSRARSGRWRLALGLAAAVGGLSDAAAAGRPPRKPALRFAGRLQLLSGAALTLPRDAGNELRFAAYVPLDAELALRVSGPLSVVLGGVAYNAPFSVSTCPTSPSARPHALAALAGVRLDFNNSRDGSWWSPWLALRGGVVGQAGVQDGAVCEERYVLAPYLSPRLGVDLWLGKAAVTFALGYDELPRAAAISLQLGLTLRLF
jgi:hypothetical protein